MRDASKSSVMRVFPTRRRPDEDASPPRIRSIGGRDAFFVRQDRMLDPLLAWGAGSVVAGGALAAASTGFRRGIGIQSAVWGLVSVGFAVAWQCSARRNAVAARSGDLGAAAIQAEARRFEHALALNTGFGAVYVAGGALLLLRGRGDGVRGSGVGIIIQGSALLAYDLGLTIWAVFRPETRFQTFGG